jgi:hypothetical protein
MSLFVHKILTDNMGALNGHFVLTFHINLVSNRRVIEGTVITKFWLLLRIHRMTGPPLFRKSILHPDIIRGHSIRDTFGGVSQSVT